MVAAASQPAAGQPPAAPHAGDTTTLFVAADLPAGDSYSAGDSYLPQRAAAPECATTPPPPPPPPPPPVLRASDVAHRAVEGMLTAIRPDPASLARRAAITQFMGRCVADCFAGASGGATVAAAAAAVIAPAAASQASPGADGVPGTGGGSSVRLVPFGSVPLMTYLPDGDIDLRWGRSGLGRGGG
jgi:hypothetical protein